MALCVTEKPGDVAAEAAKRMTLADLFEYHFMCLPEASTRTKRQSFTSAVSDRFAVFLTCSHAAHIIDRTQCLNLH